MAGRSEFAQRVIVGVPAAIVAVVLIYVAMTANAIGST